MQKIIIDQELKDLLPPLDPETYRLLEENILEHGLREPLVLWKNEETIPSGKSIAGEGSDSGILIDGHNRYAICSEHNIPFKTTLKDFATREEVLIWIIGNQVSRRNLTPIQLSHFRGLHYQADKKIQGKNNQHAQKSEKSEFPTFHSGSTASRLSEQYNVSRDTILRDSKLAEAINLIGETSPEAKRKILSGEIAVSRTKLEALNLNAKEEIEAIAAGIEEGTYVRRTQRTPNQAALNALLPELKQLNVIIKDFTSNFHSMILKYGTDDTADMKPVLRSYIDQLEDLYQNFR